MNEPRAGRPRRYSVQPDAACRDPAAGYGLGLLDECLERVVDLIADLSPEQLSAVPSGLGNSIQMLVTHMTWAEAHWVEVASGVAVPESIAAMRHGSPFPVLERTAEQLIDEVRQMRERYTRPTLRRIESIDRVVEPTGNWTRRIDAVTPRGALMHVTWHWMHHTGQVGLLRRLNGAPYQWTIERRVIGAS